MFKGEIVENVMANIILECRKEGRVLVILGNVRAKLFLVYGKVGETQSCGAISRCLDAIESSETIS